MKKVLLVFDSEKALDEFLKTSTELGYAFERVSSLILLGKDLSEEELIALLYEIEVEVLKHLRLYTGEFDYRSCEELLEVVPRAEPIESFFDDYLFKNIGRILINTKIFFHPIISVQEKRVWAFEALCRPPVHIVSLLSIGKKTSRFSETFCRDRALDRFSEFRDYGIYLFLNFHPKFLKDPFESFGDFLSSVYLYGLSPERIVVELTEHEEMELNTIKHLISFLKSEKVKVALDDVGAGYSGLFYLSELKPDIIKIDMELIRDVHKHNLKKVIVNHLIKIAHENNMIVVAEGVEKLEELKILAYMGVDLVQGFLFSKPIENPNFEELNKKAKEILSSV